MTAKEFAEKNIGKNATAEYFGIKVGMVVGYTNDNLVIISFPSGYGWLSAWLSNEHDHLLIKSPLNVGFLYFRVHELKIVEL